MVRMFVHIEALLHRSRNVSLSPTSLVAACSVVNLTLIGILFGSSKCIFYWGRSGTKDSVIVGTSILFLFSDM